MMKETTGKKIGSPGYIPLDVTTNKSTNLPISWYRDEVDLLVALTVEICTLMMFRVQRE